MIRWPERHRPEVSALHAVNELQIAAPRERVWELLRRPDLWPTYYRNSRFVRHLGGPWPAVEQGSRFRWFTFGVIVVSEIVEFEPPARIAWSAKEFGAEGPPRLAAERARRRHLRPHRGDPARLGDDAGAPGDAPADAEPAPALARGPGPGRRRGRPSPRGVRAVSRYG